MEETNYRRRMRGSPATTCKYEKRPSPRRRKYSCSLLPRFSFNLFFFPVSTWTPLSAYERTGKKMPSPDLFRPTYSKIMWGDKLEIIDQWRETTRKAVVRDCSTNWRQMRPDRSCFDDWSMCLWALSLRSLWWNRNISRLETRIREENRWWCRFRKDFSLFIDTN